MGNRTGTGGTERIEFQGSQDATLAARLDLPDGEPRAYALFAHCFTCSKDVFAAARISAGLAGRGFAVLRFDFTGLGASDGDFANTNFSSNVEDLIRAAGWLRANRRAPDLLVGHSLGGAAVLAAAGDIPEARAVATVGAPADPAHVAHNFKADIGRIEADGAAEVRLAGRTFTIRRQFLEDIEGQRLADRIGAMKKALIVFHAPLDATVGVENAGAIFQAAMHPKSFVSLDDADHLLTRRADAVYVADVLSSWAARYLPEPERAAQRRLQPEPGELIVYEAGTGKFAQIVDDGEHRLLADEPVSVGGNDTGPTPYGYLAAALGACTTMTLRMYADRKEWPVDWIATRVRHDKVHAKDCANCETKAGKIDRLARSIEIRGGIDAAQRARLLEIADRCPVHQTLERSNLIETEIRQVVA
ncbi:MAG: alpha/beta fold hydrolase [Rhodospirillaceae bacterium]|nr:alpha/beta fold hydrolase [Rhodospirillaceae bacterium]